MTREEIGSGQVILNEQLVYSMLNPDPGFTGLGEHDPLASYLYEPIQGHEVADVMTAFIDASEKYIDKGDVDSELNHLKIQRLFAIVGDTPTTVSLDERLKAWQHLLDADWVHMYSQPGDLDRAMSGVAEKDEIEAMAIYNRMKHLFMRKVIQFDTSVGFSEDIPRLSRRDYDLDKAMQGYDRVKEARPEMLPLYNSIAILAMSLSMQSLVEN